MRTRILADGLLLTWSFIRNSTTHQWSENSVGSLAGQFKQSDLISSTAQNNRIKRTATKRTATKRPGNCDGSPLIEN